MNQPSKRKIRAVLIGAGTVFAAAVIFTVVLIKAHSGNGIATGSLARAATEGITFTVRGTQTVTCVSYCEGYRDFHDGAQATLVNEQQAVLSVATLSESGPGVYSFTFTNVPRGEKLYGVHVGNVNRGVIWKTEDQLRTEGIDLTIGS